MPRQQQSPTSTTFLISLTASQHVVEAVGKLHRENQSLIPLPAPMMPLLPVVETAEQQGPPVTGRLPRCQNPLRLSSKLIRPEGSPWWIWPLDSNGWLEELGSALSPGTESTLVPLFPLTIGIPLGISEESGINVEEIWPKSIAGTVPGWRVLNLTCLEIQYKNCDNWYRSMRWRPVWTRRLSRAPSATNNNK